MLNNFELEIALLLAKVTFNTSKKQKLNEELIFSVGGGVGRVTSGMVHFYQSTIFISGRLIS